MTVHKNFWNIFQQASGFLVLFVAYNASENLQSSIMEDLGFGNLGFYNLAAIQFSQIFSTLLATSIIANLGFRMSHCIGTLGITFWILASALPAMKKNDTDEYSRDHSFIYANWFIYTINIVSSIFCGISNGVLWTVQGNYTSDCTTEKTKGFYFSFFWIFYMSSQIVGNLIGAVVLGNLNEATFFYIMTVIAISSIFIFATLRNPVKPSSSSRNSVITDLGQSINGEIVLLDKQSTNFANVIDEEEEKTTLIRIKLIIQCMVSKKMLLLLPQLAWTGISIAYYAGMLVLMMTSALEDTDHDIQSQYRKAMFAMVVFGVGEITGGPCIGYVVDKFNSKTACLLNLFIIVMMTLITLAFLATFEYSWLAFAMTFLWGFQDGAVNTHSQGILGFEFENNSDPFAVLCCLQGIFCFIFEITQSFIRGQANFMNYSIAVGVIGLACCGTTYFFDFKQHEQHKSDKINESLNSSVLEEDQ